MFNALLFTPVWISNSVTLTFKAYGDGLEIYRTQIKVNVIIRTNIKLKRRESLKSIRTFSRTIDK